MSELNALGLSDKPPPYNPDTKDRLAELGAIQYSFAEVAADFGVTEAALLVLFEKHPPARKIYQKKLADARMHLRGVQLKLAEKSPTMAIFLGKHYLGQAERRELDASARAAETAADARLVRHAFATLAADRDTPGGGGSGEDGLG